MIPASNYPVICFNQSIFLIRRSEEDLTLANKLGLRRGFFNDLKIVDSKGVLYHVAGASKICGVGLFWGYDLFLSQRIRVALHFSGEPRTISVEDIKDMIRKCGRGWSLRQDREELWTSVLEADSVSEIFQVFCQGA
jgi:hypothetical protein